VSAARIITNTPRTGASTTGSHASRYASFQLCYPGTTDHKFPVVVTHAVDTPVWSDPFTVNPTAPVLEPGHPVNKAASLPITM
jgi:hypothetical protein